MGRRGRLRPRCGLSSTTMPSGLEWNDLPYRGTLCGALCPQLVLAPPADVACNGGGRGLFWCARVEKGARDLAKNLPGKGPRAGKRNHREIRKPPPKTPKPPPDSPPTTHNPPPP